MRRVLGVGSGVDRFRTKRERTGIDTKLESDRAVRRGVLDVHHDKRSPLLRVLTR